MSTTYLDLADPAYTEIEDIVRATYKNSCIVWIEKVENKALETEFEAYKATKNIPNVYRLFHGTNEEAARHIIRGGFDPKLNKTSAYGKGVYFSKRAAYSKAYSRMRREDDMAFMFVCDVVTGICGQGRTNQKLPPEWDSFTDNLRKPDMYIVNRREAALPRYLVAFYPKAT